MRSTPSRAAWVFVTTTLAAGCAQPVVEEPDAFRVRRDAASDAIELDAGPPALCPPAPPYGTQVGDVLSDFTVYDCAGTPIQLHSLCETDVVWMWELAEWCSPCRRFAESYYDDIESHYESAYGERFAGLAIITADDQLNLPNEAICAELRDRYGIDSPLYFDPTGRFRDLIGPGYSNDVHVILTRGMRIEWAMQFGGEFVNRRIQETFDALDSDGGIPDASLDLDAGPLDDVTTTVDDAGASDDAGPSDDATATDDAR
ncbi:MAG: hypothetical protein K1X94_35360 [Sandaracinaceae bacterium]|nr:hypothetical protein [Sandaracinaceae bacterium]